MDDRSRDKPRDRADREAPAFVSGVRVMQRLLARGDLVHYARKALFPVLEVEVVMREVAREQLGILEQALLALVGDGVPTTAVLAELLGISAPRLGSFVTELVHRGLIAADSAGRLELSETGRLARQRGCEVTDVTRALLLSGLDGSL